MSQGPDRQAFEIVTSPFATSKPEFQEIVRSIAAVDTLEQFVRDMRARFPENASQARRTHAAGSQTRQLRPILADRRTARAILSRA